MKVKMFLLAICLAVLPLVNAGCTSYVDFSGYVYQWTNAPSGAKSAIFYGETTPAAYQLVPLTGAVVFIEDEDESHKFTIETDADGYFHLGTTVELAENIIVDVSDSGYHSVSRQIGISKDKYFYKFVVVLVPVS